MTRSLNIKVMDSLVAGKILQIILNKPLIDRKLL